MSRIKGKRGKGHEFFGWFRAGTERFYAIGSSEISTLG
jgi:hypothetical protein